MSTESPFLDILFVYGTLLKDAEHLMSSYLLERSTFLGPGMMPGQLYKVDFYPGAIHDPASETQVYGELYQLSEPQKVLEVLDGYEGFDPQNEAHSLFRRTQVEIMQDGNLLTSWVYVYNQSPEGFPLIPSGDFLKYEFQQIKTS
ncbi:MAG: gamma-glutamylcyclotransferase family protein [Bacteroidota bacterium]